MIEISTILLIAIFVFIKINKFNSKGITEGIIKEVKTEITDNDGSPYNEQMRGTDNRMYRYYVEYLWNGQKYIAKSYNAYSTAKYFPNDKVRISINKENENIVKIIERI